MNNNLNPSNIFRNMLSMGTNPMQIQQMLFSQNPQLQVIANQMNGSGLNPIQFVIQYARQNNIPINEQALAQQYNMMMGMIPHNNINNNK